MEISYHAMQASEALEVSEMISLAFEKFLAKATPLQGQKAFAEARSAQKLANYATNPKHILWVAKIEQKIVGMIELHEAKHLRLLFVHPSNHYQGIAKELLHLALKKSKQQNPNLIQITVKSSPYAVGFYKRQGFEQDGDWEVKNGIRHLPMVLKLK